MFAIFYFGYSFTSVFLHWIFSLHRLSSALFHFVFFKLDIRSIRLDFLFNYYCILFHVHPVSKGTKKFAGTNVAEDTKIPAFTS